MGSDMKECFVSTRPLEPDDSKEDEASVPNVDQILQDIVQPCGLWQWSIAFLLMFSCSSLMTFPVYANSASPHRCRMEPELEEFFEKNNFSFEQIAAIIGPWSSTLMNHSSKSLQGCFRYHVNWNEIPKDEISKLKVTQQLEPCPMGYVHDNDPYFYPGNVVRDFETVCEQTWLVPLGTSIYMVGAGFGNFLGGWSGGRFGRKKTLLLFSFIELFCGIWTSLSPNYLSYVLARCCMGIGVVAKSNVAGILMMELTLARYRSLFQSILSLGLSFVHRALMALLAYLIPQWRWLNLAVTAPNLLSVFYICFLPESPRWLFSQKRYSEGIAVLKAGYLINHIRKPKCALDKLLKLEHASETLKAAHAIEKKDKRALKFQCFSRNRSGGTKAMKITILSTLIMSGLTMSFIGLMFYARMVRHYVYAVSFFNALTSVPGIILFTFLYRLPQRKRPLLTLVSLAFFIYFLSSLYTVLVKPSSDVLLIICSNICLVLLQASLNMCILYIPELSPSETRTQNYGFIMGLSKVGVIMCSFVNVLDSHVAHGVPLLVYSGALLFVLGALMFLNDTDGQNLPDN